MKTSEIFQACIPLIEKGEVFFICHAVYRVLFGDKWLIAWHSKDDLLEHECLQAIEDIIGFDCLQNYLGDRCAENAYSHKDVKHLRLWWLHNLVLQYQAKGD